MLIEPSRYLQNPGSAQAALCDTIWRDAQKFEETGPGFVSLFKLPWVEGRIVKAAAWLFKLRTEGKGKDLPFKIRPGASVDDAEQFFVSGMLGVVAGKDAGERVDQWIWKDLAFSPTEEIFRGGAREAVRAVLTRHGRVEAGGLAWGVFHRGSAVGEQFSAYGAPTVKADPFTAGASAARPRRAPW